MVALLILTNTFVVKDGDTTSAATICRMYQTEGYIQTCPAHKEPSTTINHGKRNWYFRKSHLYLSLKLVFVDGCHDDDIGDPGESFRSFSASDQWMPRSYFIYDLFIRWFQFRPRPSKPTKVESINEDGFDRLNIKVNVKSLTTFLKETALHHHCK